MREKSENKSVRDLFFHFSEFWIDTCFNRDWVSSILVEKEKMFLCTLSFKGLKLTTHLGILCKLFESTLVNCWGPMTWLLLGLF